MNRLQRFIRNQTMRSMFGLPDISLDLGRGSCASPTHFERRLRKLFT